MSLYQSKPGSLFKPVNNKLSDNRNNKLGEIPFAFKGQEELKKKVIEELQKFQDIFINQGVSVNPMKITQPISWAVASSIANKKYRAIIDETKRHMSAATDTKGLNAGAMSTLAKRTFNQMIEDSNGSVIQYINYFKNLNNAVQRFDMKMNIVAYTELGFDEGELSGRRGDLL